MQQYSPMKPLTLLPGLLLLCLAGCTPTPHDQLADYHQRLARVLELEPLPLDSDPLPVLPSRQDLTLPETTLRISLLDFLRLRCELSRAVGERNSALGVVAQPSQRLHLSREVLMLGPACVQRLRENRPQLALELKQLLQLKTRERTRLWWNAWLSSEEWQGFTRRGSQPLPLPEQEPDPPAIDAGLQALDYALQQGVSWQQQEYEYVTEIMEQHQQQLLLSELVGRWRQSQRLLTRLSDASAQLLRQRQEHQPLCRHGRPTERARYLQNVFRNFYVGRVQPYLSRVDRLGDQLLSRLQALPGPLLSPPEAAVAVASDAAPLDTTALENYQQWLRQLERERAALDRAHRAHVTAWQETLRQCNMMPGPPAADAARAAMSPVSAGAG